MTAISRNQRYMSRWLDVYKEVEERGGKMEVADKENNIVVIDRGEGQGRRKRSDGRSSNKGGCYFRMNTGRRPSLIESKIKAGEDSSMKRERSGREERKGLHW